MPNYTITITDLEKKCLDTMTSDVGSWITGITTNRALVAAKEISKLDVRHCNTNSIGIATGRDAQVLQAFSLGVVKTAAQRNAEADANLPQENIMPSYTVTLSDAQDKAISYVSDVEAWINGAVTGLAGAQKKRIINALVDYCDDNDIAIASGESAQIDQAVSLGIAST